MYHPKPFQKQAFAFNICKCALSAWKSLQRLIPVLGNKELGRRSCLGDWTQPRLLPPRMLKTSRVSVLRSSCRAEIGGEAQLHPREVCSASAGSLSPRRCSSLLTTVHKRVILLPTRRGTARLKGMGGEEHVAKGCCYISCSVEQNGLSLAQQPLLALCRDLAQSKGWPCPESRASHSIDTGGQEHRSGPALWGRAEMWQQELFKLHLHGNIQFLSFFKTY